MLVAEISTYQFNGDLFVCFDVSAYIKQKTKVKHCGKSVFDRITMVDISEGTTAKFS